MSKAKLPFRVTNYIADSTARAKDRGWSKTDYLRLESLLLMMSYYSTGTEDNGLLSLAEKLRDLPVSRETNQSIIRQARTMVAANCEGAKLLTHYKIVVRTWNYTHASTRQLWLKPLK